MSLFRFTCIYIYYNSLFLFFFKVILYKKFQFKAGNEFCSVIFNLQGEVMPIGGVKEKILAAKRNKIPHVILPEKNKNDLVGMESIADGIQVVWVKHAAEVLQRVLMGEKKKAVEVV